MQLFKLLNIAIPRIDLPWDDEEPRPPIRMRNPQTGGGGGRRPILEGILQRLEEEAEITEDYVPLPPEPQEEISKEPVNLFSDFFVDPKPPQPSGPENEVIGGFTPRRFKKNLLALVMTFWMIFWLVIVPYVSYTIRM